MTRPIFWPTQDSSTSGLNGQLFAGIPVLVFSQRTGGTQVTDLLFVNPDGSFGSAVPNGLLISDSDGLIPAFAGPDGSPTTIWANIGANGHRLALTADPAAFGGSGGTPADGSITPAKLSSGVPASIASSAAMTGTYGPGSTQWLQSIGGSFGFGFATITTTDSATGLPTAATVKWPDATAGTFTGTIDSGGNGYSGFVVTWAGTATKTLTVTGITYDTNGNPIGPTGLVVS